MPDIITTEAAISPVGAMVFGQDTAGVPGYMSASFFSVPVEPSGDETFVIDSAALQAAIDSLAATGGGVISLRGGIYYAKDVELKSGVSIIGNAVPSMNPNQCCPDLGLSATTPFASGAVFKGTGIETVFFCNTDDLEAPLSAAFNPLDIAISGTMLANIAGWDILSLITAGAANHLGLGFCNLENLYGYGIDGTFIDLVNPQHVRGKNLKVIDGNHLLRVGAYHCACQPGNSYFEDLYLYSWAEPSGAYAGKNTDWGIKLDSRSAGASVGGGALNYIQFGGRIQVNGFRDVSLDRARGNACIKIEGTTAPYQVNSCSLSGLDLEGKWSYGVSAINTTNMHYSVAGTSSENDFIAVIKVKNALQNVISSHTAGMTLSVIGTSSAVFSGFLKFYAYDYVDGYSDSALGVYMLISRYTSGGGSAPVYTPIKTNGVVQLQLGYTEGYRLEMSGSENVLRPSLIPIARQITPITADKTWNRWEASTVLLSGAITTQTLPVIDSKIDGVEFTFKSADSNTHTIVGQSSQLIDGAANYALGAGLQVTVMAVATGTKWVVVGV
ncbi:MAG TPA: hypothetical protein DCS09_02250 [Porphyromonadaceae bacterium]|nr:hypothetical protein [Porphyromonadaceae bacterium]